MKMTQVTLRNIDPKLKKLIDQRAKKSQKSINTYVVDLIKDSIGYTQTKHKPWRAYAGVIPDCGISQEALDDFASIDKTMWQ